MVISAREEASKDHEIVLRKNNQLKAQLADTENLLKSHQEQLAELKHVMEQMNEERDDQANSTAPSTPSHIKFDGREENTEASEGAQSGSVVNDISPSHPTSFIHLIQPVLRADLAAFDDFASLLRMSKNHAAGSRVSSGSYGSIGPAPGMGTNQSPSSAAPSNGSTTSINSPATIGSSPATPTTPASTVNTGLANAVNAISLKETRFYKRALVEDIEPTLRLDTAPGLSWLARRTVLNAMCEGTLVVEPMPTTSTARVYVFACSLCGETRKDPTHMRTHRFRTSESDSAQRYPLCKYCLGRVRSSCDFLGFLRVLKDGHWRTDDEESERAAWEECVRLREQMFWSRIGGGVIPASNLHHGSNTHGREKTSRTSEDERSETEIMQRLSEETDMSEKTKPKDVTSVAEITNPDEARNKAFLAERRARKQSSLSNDTAEGLWEASQADALPPDPEVIESTAADNKDTLQEKEKTNRDSTLSLSVSSDGKRDEKRLSITIPGSIE